MLSFPAQSYGHISFSNVSDSTLPPSSRHAEAEPHMPVLELDTVPARPSFSVCARGCALARGAFSLTHTCTPARTQSHLNRRSLDEVRRSIRSDGSQVRVRVADVYCAHDSDPKAFFHVLADGELFGPFQAIR